MNKKVTIIAMSVVMLIIAVVIGCAPMQFVALKNPEVKTTTFNKVMVMTLLKNLNYLEPFEDEIVKMFNMSGIKAVSGLDYFNPMKQYKFPEMKAKIDSLGIQGVLFITVKKSNHQQYIPPSTTVMAYPGYYGFYDGFYPGFYGGWGFSADVVSTPGYWQTITDVDFNLYLYVNDATQAMWTAEASVEDPQSTSITAQRIAEKIIASWKKDGIIQVQTK